MNNATRQRPDLPRELYEPSLCWTALLLVYAVCLYVIPASLLYVVATDVRSFPLKIVLMIPLTIVAAYGLNLLGFVGHEGMHGSLTRGRYTSAVIGIFCASCVVTYFEVGFAMQHWNHHRYTNQSLDHDMILVMRFKKWWTRLLFSRWIYNWEYFKRTVQTAMGRPNPFRFKMPFKPGEQRMLAWLNLLFAAGWIAVYAWLAVHSPLAGLVCIMLPMMTVLFIAACQTYIDHGGTNDELFGNAWSRTSPLMTAAYFGANYHLEHHAYPGIPCYRLPRVHRILKENGTYERRNPPIVRGFIESFRNLAAPYEPQDIGGDFNAFDIAGKGEHEPGESGDTAKRG
jgi:fatty acid desaturase